MLSEHERRVLTAIENDLHDRDPEFAEALRDGRSPPRRRHRRNWPSLLVIGLGVLVLATGLVTGTSPLVVQGLLVTAGGVGYRHWRRWRRAGRARRHGLGRRDMWSPPWRRPA